MPHFQILERAPLYPQLCIFCLRSLEREECLDTGTFAPGDGTGRIYLCLDCLDDVAKATNLMRRSEANELVARNKELEAQAKHLPAIVEGVIDDIGTALDRGISSLRERTADAVASHPAPRKKRVTGGTGFTTADLNAVGVSGGPSEVRRADTN